MIIYHILIDRFAGFSKQAPDAKENWVGGTLKGIEDHLPYLKRLGVTALRLGSPWKSTAYHGYTITDLRAVDPHFGTEKDLKRLIKKAHQFGMRVFLDFIATHISDQHPFFKDAIRSHESPYRTWFSFKKWPRDYAHFLTISSLPKWNFKNPLVQTYLIETAISWLRNLRCDGFFIDHVIGAPQWFWKKFAGRIQRAQPNAILVGEVWFDEHTPKNYLPSIAMKRARKLYRERFTIRGGVQDAAMKQYVGILDGCLDFTMNRLIRDYFIRHRISEKTFMERVRSHYARFPKHFLLPVFLDSHDLNRFLFQTKNTIPVLKAAAEFQYGLPQPTLVYYGTEIGMTQKKIWGSHHGNQEARKKMEWSSRKQNRKLLTWYRKLGRSRSLHAS